MREHRKILVIEDEKNLRLLYQQELARDGFDVVTAATASDGIAMFESERQEWSPGFTIAKPSG